MTQPSAPGAGEARVALVALLAQAVGRPLTYLVPDALRETCAPGVVVAVPLQRKLTTGIVVDLGVAVDAHGLKPIHSLLDPQPALNAAQLDLARWIAREYLAPLGRCCALMVPPGFTAKSAYVYSLPVDPPRVPRRVPARDSNAGRIIDVLAAHGPLIESKLASALKDVRDWRATLKRLVAEGAVERGSTLQPPRAQPKRSTLAQLTIGADTIEVACARIDQAPRMQPQVRARRIATLNFLHARNGMAWADWIMAETGANRVDLAWLEDQGYVILGDAERWRDPLSDVDYVPKEAPPLTLDQQRAWDAIAREPQHYLLRGVTGSGKTEIYMRAVERALRAGKGAIVLVPEISLTPQTARRFLERFPGRVALIHSKLKSGERFDTWRRIRSGELPIVVGARSALFAPVRDVGLIVLDEEHDPSYKQGSPPHYDARRVAERYAAQTGATLIFGSATPSLEAWQRADLKVLELPNRVRGHVARIEQQGIRLGVHAVAQREGEAVAYQPLPEVQVVDMRAELRGGNTGMFSGALFQAIGETLRRGEQAILFLNRRGAASAVVCRDCGHAMRCPNDEAPLTLHMPRLAEGSGLGPDDGKQLRCHQCNHAEPVPARCPTCGSPRIRFIGLGTQKIEHAIGEHFPRARVVRWDRDAASAGSADHMLQRFVNRQADVLIGTQMIAKGLDLPLVTLVGVVLADVGLFLPDFRASERVFNLLEQVAGRAGRGLLPGRVIVQTYNPEHPAIAFASRHDVRGFARHELAQRRALRLPPYTRLVRFECADETEANARQACEHVARQLRRRLPAAGDVIGPAQAYFTRRNKRYRWQVIVRTLAPGELLDGLDIPRGCVVDVDPVSVL